MQVFVAALHVMAKKKQMTACLCRKDHIPKISASSRFTCRSVWETATHQIEGNQFDRAISCLSSIQICNWQDRDQQERHICIQEIYVGHMSLTTQDISPPLIPVIRDATAAVPLPLPPPLPLPQPPSAAPAAARSPVQPLASAAVLTRSAASERPRHGGRRQLHRRQPGCTAAPAWLQSSPAACAAPHTLAHAAGAQ